MSAEKHVFGFIHQRRERVRPPHIGVELENQPAVSLPDSGLVRAGAKAKDLVGLLVRHYARTRLSARPRVRTTLQVFTPAGKPAVKVYCEQA